MHNEAFAYLGLDYAYLAFEVDNNTLEDAVKGIRALKLVGSNVSMPNKTVVGQYFRQAFTCSRALRSCKYNSKRERSTHRTHHRRYRLHAGAQG